MRRYIKRALEMMHFLPTGLYLRLSHWVLTGRWPDLRNPETFSEKLHWLKMRGGTERYRDDVDKRMAGVGALLHAKGIKLPRVLGLYVRAKDIAWDKLPDRFVLKCTHGSHCTILVPDKAAADKAAIGRQLDKWMRRNWYWYGREPAYRGIQPLIMAQEMIGQGAYPPDDYKIMCFGGSPRVIQRHRKRGRETRIDFFYADGQRIDMHKPGYPRSQCHALPIADVDKLLSVARAIAREIDVPYVRVDLYLVAGQVYFGEVTFFDSAGYRLFDARAEARLGGMIELGGIKHV